MIGRSKKQVLVAAVLVLATVACDTETASSPSTEQTLQTRTETPAPAADWPTTLRESDAEVLDLAVGGVLRNSDWSPTSRFVDGVEMVLVPAGCFPMGSSDTEVDDVFASCSLASDTCRDQFGRAWFESQIPQHHVCISEPFWIDRFEVTNSKFQRFGGVAGSPATWDEPDLPRETINWLEAADFCELRGARLPTEAEWEYAARGPDGWAFPWGNEFVPNNVEFEANSLEQPAAVGSRPSGASWVGALDMSGNVEEWVHSFYQGYPYEAEDGREANYRINAGRVKRGGSWTNWGIGPNVTAFLRSANRSGQDAIWGNHALGFRCAIGEELTPVSTGEAEPPWPAADPGQLGMDEALLDALVDDIRTERYAIDNVTVVKDGSLVLDEYFSEYDQGSMHIIHSCTKSITATLIGIAIDQGFIESIDQPVLDFFLRQTIENTDGRKSAMTLRDLLTMSSGFSCRDSEAVLDEMRASSDWTQHMLDHIMGYTPGSRFEYCSGNSHLLSAILQQVTGMSAFAFARENLFEPLGITDVYWPASMDGVTHGWGDMHLTPHDMARIGYLYLNDGIWDGVQIVSSVWVNEATTAQLSTSRGADIDGYTESYGYQWWVDEQYYAAIGRDGQFIYVVPDLDMVVVFTANLHGDGFAIPERLLMDYIIPAAS